jgi:hypothetical protein
MFFFNIFNFCVLKQFKTLSLNKIKLILHKIPFKTQLQTAPKQ